MADRQDYQKEYREKNKERLHEQHKIYRETHQEQIKAYRQSHKEQAKVYNKRYREKNRDKLIAYSRNYRKIHEEELKEKRLEYYRDNYNREKEAAKMREWRQKGYDATIYYANRNRKLWTAEEVDRLFELQEMGLTSTEIAITLGRTKGAVDIQLYKRRSSKKHNEDGAFQELQDLIELYRINSNLGEE